MKSSLRTTRYPAHRKPAPPRPIPADRVELTDELVALIEEVAGLLDLSIRALSIELYGEGGSQKLYNLMARLRREHRPTVARAFVEKLEGIRESLE